MSPCSFPPFLVICSPADPEFEPIYAELDRRGAVLYIHPAGVGACSPLIANYGLTWPIGAPIEDTISTMQLIDCEED